MKKLFYSLLFIMSVTLLPAQDLPQMRALNPDFVNFMTAKNNGTINMQSSEGYFLGNVPSPLLKTFDNFIPNTTKGIPSSYDLRTENGGAWLTPVKNQGLEGACWAFATYAAVESYWKKQGLSTYDLSEQNLATCHGFDWTPSEGGNSDLSVAYLSRRSGPISEADDPYVLPTSPTCETGLTPVAYVAQSRTLPGSGDAAFSRDAVKQAIMDYGVLYTNMYYDDTYMNNTNYTYYYNGSNGTNHGVAIVGWDNSKVCSGAAAGTPSLPGAWIIKNSWGTSWGQSGYFYISYYDTEALSDVCYFPSHIDYNSNSQVYYYDDFGAISAVGFNDGDDYALIKYVASGNQQLSKLGTYILDANTTVSFDVYDNFNGTTLSGLLGSITNQACALPGYYTFDLSTAINLTSGNDFYIRVRYNSGENYPVPIETEYAGFASTVNVETGKCWISNSGSGWTAIGGGTSYDYDLCIKAYATTTASSAPTANFTADQTTVTVGTTVYFSDLSTGVPTSWNWDFEGGDPTSSTSTNPSVTYNTPGTYDVSLTVANGLGNDTETKANYITVTSAPITCEYVDNFEDSDYESLYYTNDDQYVSGHNEYAFTEFAEHYTGQLNNLVTGASISVGKAYSLSTDAKITMKIWSTTAGKPGTVLYSEDFDIADFTVGVSNNITFANPTTVPSDFFIGYQIYYNTPQDTFAVYQAHARDASSAIVSSAFVKYSGTWRDMNVLFSNNLNTALCVFPYICPTPPDANFTATPTSGCGSLTVTFTDASSSNTDSWDWDFGDGQTSTDQNPTHIYNTPGTYTVSLTCTNAIGTDTKTMTDYIVVGTIPTDVTVSGGGTQCGGTMLLSTSGGTGGTIYWQNTTSNGTSTSIASSSQSVSASGTYYFRARSVEGCWGNEGYASVTIYPLPSVDLGDDQQSCGEYITFDAGTGFETYVWNGTPYNQTLEVGVTGDYTVVVTDVNGCTATDMIHVDIFEVPYFTTSFTPETGTGASDGSASVDVTYVTGPQITWSNNETTATITGLSAGFYFVTVQNSDGCTATETVFVPLEAAPVANFSADNTHLCDNYTVNFSDESENFPTIWAWNFGDGGMESGTATPSHTYSEPGVYTVSLYVSNDYGEDEIIKTDYITIGETPEIIYETIPASNFNPYGGEIHVTVSGGSEPYTVEWEHDSEETSLDITGLESGNYYLTVTEVFGCQSSSSIFVDFLMLVSDYSNSYEIYPNPASNNLYISNINGEGQIQIINILGEIVYDEKIPDSRSIDISSFATGTYFVKIESQEINHIEKIVIE